MQLTFERKLLRVMRLTSIILLASCLSVAAKTVSQTVTYKGTDVPLETIFKVVKQQTGYFFIYNPAVLENARPVTVIADQVPLEDFLRGIFKDQQLDFIVKDKTIAIKPKEIISPPQIPMTLLPIAGVVKGVDGKPLANVSITVKGSEKGTTTDADGKFNIDVKEGDVLVVSSIGFGLKEVKINTANSNLIIALDISSSPLDEVQVIAYGETSQRLNPGSVATVKSEEISKQPVTNPLLALQGRAAGLFVTQATGLPGSGVTVLIRGQNSLINGNDPFYVVDGVPYPSQLLPSHTSILGTSGVPNGAVTQSGNPLNYINPADIESISILKDADATAIYGSRAANGAILITTKKGKIGKTKVEVNMQKGWGKVTRFIDLMNTQQYLEMRHEAKKNDNAPIYDFDYDINGTYDTTRNTDWQKTLVGETAQYDNLSASVSGGTPAMQYLVGVTYNRQTSVMPIKFADKRGSVHFNINSKSTNDKFKLRLSGFYLSDDNRLPNRDPFVTATALAPNAPALYNPDGTLNWALNSSGSSTWSSLEHPLALYNSKYFNKTSNLVSNAELSYELLSNLVFKTSFGYNKLSTDEMTTAPMTTYAPEFQIYNFRTGQYGFNDMSLWIIEPQLHFDRHVGKVGVNAFIGTSINQIDKKGLQLFGSGYNTDEQLEDIRSAGTSSVNSSVASTYKYNALYGRVTFNTSDKYILNLSARRDGSSRFGPQNRFHNFSAVGAAWIFSKESFFEKNIPLLSFGKFRVSYGTTGNDAIPEYQYLSLYTPVDGNVPYQGIRGMTATRLTNPYLQWEETKKFEAGIELGFLKDRILFNGSYYRNQSSNQLLNYDLPGFVGFESITKNFPATVRNDGWELSVSSTNVTAGDVRWSTAVNFTLPRNKLVAFPNLENTSYVNSYIIGEPVNIFKAFKMIGVDPETGAYLFSNDKGEPVPVPTPFKDNIAIIKLAPEFYGGFQNTFVYKGLQLDVLLQFVKQIAPSNRLGNTPGWLLTNQPVSVLDRWQQPGDNATVQRFSQDFSVFLPSIYSGISDAAFEDASYVRMKNVSLSWNLPHQWISGAKLENARIYMQAQNLLTFTSYDGDPEVPGKSSLPPLRIITVGLQVGL